MQFEIRSAATGQVCCSSIYPDHLCPTCQADTKARLLAQARDLVGRDRPERRRDAPFDDANYDPHGAPPNGYDIAIQKLNRPAKPNYPRPESDREAPR
jgi:hypothetical protein